MTPGQNANHSLAGALQLVLGTILPGLGPRKNHGVLRALLTLWERTYPEQQGRRRSAVGDHDKRHTAPAGAQWWAAHPRLALLWVPTSCPPSPSSRAGLGRWARYGPTAPHTHALRRRSQ